MISKDIYLDDKFSDLPVTTRLLYTYCDLLADDDGFISSVKQAMFFSNAGKDDLQNLVNSKFLIKFESGVYCIRHWKLMNEIKKDRYTPTIHIEEMAMLKTISDKNKTYEVVCIQNGNKMDTQDSIGQYQGSLGQISTVQGSTVEGSTAKEKIDDIDANSDDEVYKTFQFFTKKRNKEVKDCYMKNIGVIRKPQDWEMLKKLVETHGAGFVILCIEKVAAHGGGSMEYLEKTCKTTEIDG